MNQSLLCTEQPESHPLMDMASIFQQSQTAIGRTAPNPPVAAGAFDVRGKLLGTAVHTGAGHSHAEAMLIQQAEAGGWLSDIHSLYITLEPCNHHGRTPPCTQAIIRAGIKNVFYGIDDPNPVASGGGDFLRQHGVNVVSGVARAQAAASLLPFLHTIKTGKPFVVVKTAHRVDGNMVPLTGQKTFTAAEDLLMAHRLRKSSDAIITGSGTVLADTPSFTVRHLPDYPGRVRHLVILDRRRRVPGEYIERQKQLGFDVTVQDDYARALEYLAQQGCLQVLVEAGPAITAHVERTAGWQQWVRFYEEKPGAPVSVYADSAKGVTDLSSVDWRQGVAV